ncbi:4535_t:CDS:2, partial [Entrophospora sp. SA101]
KFDEETVGTEVRGPRPGLIISDNSYNQISKRVIVLPCSRTLDPLYSFELFVPQLVKVVNGKVMIDQIQCIDKERLGDKIRSGGGKSTLARCLAVELTKQKKNILLVDLDIQQKTSQE